MPAFDPKTPIALPTQAHGRIRVRDLGHDPRVRWHVPTQTTEQRPPISDKNLLARTMDGTGSRSFSGARHD